MLLLFGTVVSLSAQDFSDFAKKVTEFTLPNGLHFILAERHEAPVVSFHTYVKAGSANDPSGQTGLAHMFEHMAFKGTETIGSRDWPSEKKALDVIEEAYDRLEAERNKGPKADPQRVAGAGDAGPGTRSIAPRPTSRRTSTRRIIEGNGGVGLNAGTVLGFDGILLQPAFEPDRAVVSDGIAALPAAGLPRVLQGARRGGGREPHARAIEPAGQAAAAVYGDRVRGAPVPQSSGRVAERCRGPAPFRGQGVLRHLLCARRTW